MEKAGLAANCISCEDAAVQAGALPADRLAALPRPGEVEFIMGGPPCQGYSGMNRFNKGNWSVVQNSMVSGGKSGIGLGVHATGSCYRNCPAVRACLQDCRLH